MGHLQLCCGSIHAIGVVKFTFEMLTYYGDAEGIPKYINMLEDAKKKVHQVQLPIREVTLVDIANKSILQSQSFNPEMKEWEKNHPMDKLRALWKSTFLEDYKGIQSQIQACGGTNQFGIANAASMVANPSRPPTSITPDILDKMDDYMDNMANSVTNKKAVLEKLTVTNAKQASTITTQATTILAL